MKKNTPLPFGSDNFYYTLYQKPADNQRYDYPSTAYGVMAWWDYGHMITQIAHRIPNANPTQAGADVAARYFVAQDESSANKTMDTLGSKYVVIDFDVAVPYNIINNSISGLKFLAMPTWAGTNPSGYAEVCYQLNNGVYSPVPVFYPEYYKSMVTRLYNFHGAQIVPNNTTSVMTFSIQNGRKRIDNMQTFPTFEAANAFVTKQNSPYCKIVGLSPFSSPVPLDKLAHYKEVYRSPSGVAYNNQRTGNSYIEIFQYTP
jgi:dolichyl-phosphooligosaccharide-protein glycotransferase